MDPYDTDEASFADNVDLWPSKQVYPDDEFWYLVDKTPQVNLFC